MQGIPDDGDPGLIEPAYHRKMNEIAAMLDHAFNGEWPHANENGFVLLVFPFDKDANPARRGDGHRCNYISNARRTDIVKLLREQADYFEKDRP